MSFPIHPINTDINQVCLGTVRKWNSFRNFPNCKNPVSFVTTLGLDIPGIEPAQKFDNYGEYIKHNNQVIAKHFGPRLHRNLPAAMYNTFIKNNFQYSTYFALRHTGSAWRVFCPETVNIAIGLKETIQQLEEDGAHHLIPAVLFFQKDPSDIRRTVGRSAWRKIANNSKTRNKLIFSKLETNFDLRILDLRSGIIQKVSPGLGLNQVVFTAAKISPTITDFYHTLNLVRDTIYMAERLGQKANPNWSYNRFVKEHERLSKEYLSHKYSPESFADQHIHNVDGYTFSRLTTPLEIAQEGKVMHHCVAFFADSALKGNYEVYTVEGKGERATLGLDVNNEGKVFIDQLYGTCNRAVSSEMQSAAQRFVVGENESEDTSGRRGGRVSRQSREDTRSVMDRGEQFEELAELPF